MLFDKKNIFDTPRLRYNKLRKDFDRKYLNPKAWSYRCDSKELVQAYHDLIKYLEETEHFRCLTPSLRTDIPTDNINLVLHELPFPLKRREELIEFVVSGRSVGVDQSQEGELQKIKEYLEIKKRGALVGVERRSNKEIEDNRRAAKGVVHANDDIFAKVDDKEAFEVKKYKKTKIENEILEIRQKLYSKLNEGQNVFPIMKKFKRKVNIFLRKYEADLSYVEEKHWKDKIIITEKAVVKRGKEIKAAKECCSKECENLAPSVREIFDAARAQEIVLENLPEPPQFEDIEIRLERLKEFNKRLLDDKNENAAKEVTMVKVDKMENVKVDRNDDTKGNDMKINDKKKKNDFFDVDEFLGKNLFWSNDSNSDESEDDANDEYEDEAHESKKEVCVNESDEGYKEEVGEFNQWYYRKLDEKGFPKIEGRKATRYYDKVAQTKPDIVKELYDDLMYKQVFDCKDDEVMRTDTFRIVALLQAIFAMLLVSGKTLHEQSVRIDRLSQLSQPSLLSQLSNCQPETPLSPSSPCSCQTQSRVCCEVTTALLEKVSGVVNKASVGVAWLRQLGGVFNHAKERMVRAANLVGRVRVIVLEDN